MQLVEYRHRFQNGCWPFCKFVVRRPYDGRIGLNGVPALGGLRSPNIRGLGESGGRTSS